VDYYTGGYRVIVNGVPTRLSFKPSKHALALMNDGTMSATLQKFTLKRHPQVTYSPIAVFGIRVCVKCGKDASHRDHARIPARGSAKCSLVSARRYAFSISGVYDDRRFETFDAANAAAQEKMKESK